MDNRCMAIPRIYYPQALRPGTEIILTGSAAKHLSRVLRLKPGDTVRLFHDDGEDYTAQIDSPVRDGLRIRVHGSEPVDTESPLRVVLMQGICRGQKMDLVIQKATELGVTAILPVQCERSVVRLDEQRGVRRREHWFGIAAGAAEQCGRAVVPRVHPPATLDAALASLPATALGLVLDPGVDTGIGEAALRGAELVVLAGPEGGLTAAERDLAQRAGFTGVRLGPRVLRTETAPLAALSILQYLYGDLAG